MEYQMGRFSCHYTDVIFMKLKPFFIRVLCIKRNKSIYSSKAICRINFGGIP